jgi:dUTP pyrophosphatase
MPTLTSFRYKVLQSGKMALAEGLLPEGLEPRFDVEGDSGLRLYAVTDVLLVPFQPTLIPHGIAVEVGWGYETQIRPRSSTMYKRRVHIALGTIDSSYSGELFSCATFFPETIRDQQGHLIAQETPLLIKAGERLSQLVVAPVANWLDIVEAEELSISSRGAGGFGSTGK